VASIEEVRAGIAAANEKATEAQGQLQAAKGNLEEAQQALSRATEGSGQADVSEANGLLAQAVESCSTTSQQVSSAISSSEGVANRL